MVQLRRRHGAGCQSQDQVYIRQIGQFITKCDRQNSPFSGLLGERQYGAMVEAPKGRLAAAQRFPTLRDAFALIPKPLSHPV